MRAPRSITAIVVGIAAIALAMPTTATAAPALHTLGSFTLPVHAASPPGDQHRLFVVEQAGVVRLVRDDTPQPTPFLDISSEVLAGGERGLLSIAFPPDYSTSGLFYVYMTAQPDGELQLREYHRSATDADRADGPARIVWRQAHPNGNHNGGQVQFDHSGLLWFATGDGGSAPGESDDDPGNDAQTLSSPLGKLMRIDPRPGNAGEYTIPPGNPFHTAVWALGLRNPYRFSFDRENGDLVIGDVGGGQREEIDWAPASEGRLPGANYGWACREGTATGPRACDPGASYVPPIFDYNQGSPRAVTAGYVVRDPGLPTLVGRFLYADAFAGQVHSFVLARPRATDDRAEPGLAAHMLVSFAEDACGRLYVVSRDGPVSRIEDGAPTPCGLTGSPPPPAPTPTVPDRTAPYVRIRAARHGRVGRLATPRISLTPTESCRVAIRARVAGARLKTVRGQLRGRRRTIVRLRPTHTGVRKIRRALRRHRRITMVVAVRAVDAAGNIGRVQRRVHLRRGRS